MTDQGKNIFDYDFNHVLRTNVVKNLATGYYLMVYISLFLYYRYLKEIGEGGHLQDVHSKDGAFSVDKISRKRIRGLKNYELGFF